MRRMVPLVIVVASIVGTSCGGPPSDSGDEICQAVFAYQFTHVASYIEQPADEFCVDLAGNDPSVEFLQRFKNHSPPVRARSTCSGDTKARRSATGMRSIMFSVSDITRTARKRVHVHGRHYDFRGSGPLEGTYYLQWQDGRWVVVDVSQPIP